MRMTSLKLTRWFGLVAAYGGTAQEKSRRSNRPARPAGSLSGNPFLISKNSRTNRLRRQSSAAWPPHSPGDRPLIL